MTTVSLWPTWMNYAVQTVVLRMIMCIIYDKQLNFFSRMANVMHTSNVAIGHRKIYGYLEL